MTSGGVIFFDRTRQPQGSFLNEIQKIQSFALISLGQIDDETKIRCDHLILGALATPNHNFFFIVVNTGWTSPSCKVAAFSDGYHRLNLPAHHEFCLG